ncbi:hypothetical protein [Shewanella sp. 125m-1]
MYHKNHLASVLFIFLSVLVNTACATQGVDQSRQQIIELSGSDMARYWVTRDKLIDWQQLLPTDTHINTGKHKAVYEVSFVVNTNGQMSQVTMKNTANGTRVPAELLVGVDDYQFFATAYNITRQAVKVNATVEL